MGKKINEFEFIGLPSGDQECFCWEVDIETFMRIKGEDPDVYNYVIKKYEDDKLEPIPIGNMVKLYPDDIFNNEYIFDENEEVIDINYLGKCKIKISFEEIE